MLVVGATVAPAEEVGAPELRRAANSPLNCGFPWSPGIGAPGRRISTSPCRGVFPTDATARNASINLTSRGKSSFAGGGHRQRRHPAARSRICNALESTPGRRAPQFCLRTGGSLHTFTHYPPCEFFRVVPTWGVDLRRPLSSRRESRSAGRGQTVPAAVNACSLQSGRYARSSPAAQGVPGPKKSAVREVDIPLTVEPSRRSEYRAKSLPVRRSHSAGLGGGVKFPAARVPRRS